MPTLTDKLIDFDIMVPPGAACETRPDCRADKRIGGGYVQAKWDAGDYEMDPETVRFFPLFVVSRG